MLRKELIIATRFTIVTTIVLGILYPLIVTGFAHVFLRRQADGDLTLIGQNFSADQYFHGRPSAAGNGYDATSSGGSNFSQSSQKLVARIQADVATYAAQNKGQAVPIDLVTASGSGLDPDISPAAALFQVARVAAARRLPAAAVNDLVRRHIEPRQFGFLGEERVNVLRLNQDLDRIGR